MRHSRKRYTRYYSKSVKIFCFCLNEVDNSLWYDKDGGSVESCFNKYSVLCSLFLSQVLPQSFPTRSSCAVLSSNRYK